jgi:ubiquinone/menaquinone biosynthesis C-methylase UbiE
LDIAAGHGLFGITIAQKNPEAQIVALDWRAVLEVATRNATASGVGDRYTTLAGSAFDVDFGSDYDVILITNFLHHFSPETNETLLRKVHAALKPSGRAITLEFVPDESRVSPPPAARFALTMLTSTAEGDAYTFAELSAMARNAGFADSTQIPLHAGQSVIISTK